MKQLLFLTICLCTVFASAQRNEPEQNCGTIYNLQTDYDETFEKFYQTQTNVKAKNPVTYYIPVVFHVIHTGEPIGTGSNISDLAIYKALERLNNNLINKHNHPNSGNTNIQFVLATKAPNGSCSTGINRINYSTNQAYVSYGNAYSTSDNGVDANTIRALSKWNNTQYYNVWVVNKITSASSVTAYAYYPTAHGTAVDGTFIRHDNLANPESATFTHEIGHSLNLMHTFQGSTGTNCPTQINGCGADGDCIADTPPHIKNHTLDLVLNAANSCSGDNNSTYKHNYMAYTYDEYRKVLTPLQIARMQSAVPFYRSSYLPANNTVFTMTQSPQAKFYVNDSDGTSKQYFCAGSPIVLRNSSTCFLNTFNSTSLANYVTKWEIIKNGQTFMVSNESNPTITINQTGIYSIKLTVTNNVGASTLTKTDVIEIVSANSVNFCTPTSLNVGQFFYSINRVKLNNIDNLTIKDRNEGYNNYSCSYITQANATGASNLSIYINNNHFSIKDNSILHAYIDFNNNGVFETNEQIANETIPTGTSNQAFSYFFVPPANVVKNIVLRMRIMHDRLNISNSKLNCTSQFNVGDIEDYGVIFINSLSAPEFETKKVNLYPNPVTNVLNIDFEDASKKSIQIFTNTGQLIKTFETSETNLKIDVSGFEAGTYHLKTDNQNFKFIKK